MKWKILVLSLSVFIFSSLHAVAGDDIAESIKAVVDKNIQATQGEDLDAMMSTIHTQSPAYLTTKQQMPLIFENFDLRYQIVSYTFIGFNAPYAIARVRQRTTKTSGAAFKNNVMDMIQVFRKERGAWKYWNQMMLDIQPAG